MKCQDCNNERKVHQYFLMTPQIIGMVHFCDECANKMSAAASRDRGIHFSRNRAVARYDIVNGEWVTVYANWDM